MNNVLDGRNWKHVIAFDNDMYRLVVHHSFLYSKRERNILNAQIEFYRNHFTMDQVIRSFAVLKTEDEIKEFISAVTKRRNKILYCPKELKQYYTDLIRKDYNEYSEFLLDLLNIACSQNSRKNPMIPIYKKVFGVYYNMIKDRLNVYSKKPLPRYVPIYSFDEAEIKRLVNNTLKNLKNDDVHTSIWGNYDVDKIDIVLSHDAGTGKHISKQFYEGSNDTYIIQTNERNAYIDQIKYAVYRNIFPGRAHLFNTLIPNRQFNFDSGADYVVNGWSAFAGWHIYPSGYTKYSKIFNAKIMYRLLKGNWQKAISDVYMFLLGNVSKHIAINHIIEITQYPGRFESFVMGGFATELLIKKKFATNPMGLLDEYNKRNVADFFALFKPNTNKC